MVDYQIGSLLYGIRTNERHTCSKCPNGSYLVDDPIGSLRYTSQGDLQSIVYETMGLLQWVDGAVGPLLYGR